jgi:hypothetical protein
VSRKTERTRARKQRGGGRTEKKPSEQEKKKGNPEKQKKDSTQNKNPRESTNQTEEEKNTGDVEQRINPDEERKAEEQHREENRFCHCFHPYRKQPKNQYPQKPAFSFSVPSSSQNLLENESRPWTQEQKGKQKERYQAGERHHSVAAISRSRYALSSPLCIL